MLVVLAALVFFMFRNSRKRQRQAAELQNQVTVGAEVMTNFGVYGKILEIDEEENQVLVETTPGTVLRVHRQTVTRVVTPVVADQALEELPSTPVIDDDTEPEYGERIDRSTPNPSDKKGDE
jgi:preprotein translocase subunit YajC